MKLNKKWPSSLKFEKRPICRKLRHQNYIKCSFTWYFIYVDIKWTQMPNEIMIYKHAIQLYKIYNATEFTLNWSILNFNQIITSRQNTFMTLKSNERKVGNNILANRLSILNGKIPFEWLNCSLPSYKVHCKKLLL